MIVDTIEMAHIVKAGDKHAIPWRVNMDLTGCTVRLIARRRGGYDPVLLMSEITDHVNGVVSHTLSGLLDVATYRVELEVTRNGEVFTFPNDGYSTLIVKRDLD
ncbi:hypothetical protein [Microbacterium sp. K24]|uniref:hypothetical protein n=1 Tax=Microbacterium sp. K24 TaxID=2305446 RepID=UPI00109D632B|nr:hypothetical protein [Microbacterium sp. K24]